MGRPSSLIFNDLLDPGTNQDPFLVDLLGQLGGDGGDSSVHLLMNALISKTVVLPQSCCSLRESVLC